MIQRAKKEVIGHFQDFGPSDRFHIAYFDYSKWSLLFGNGTTHVLHNQFCMISIVYAKKGQKMRFLDSSSNSVGLISMRLCILSDRIDMLVLRAIQVLRSVLIYA